MDELTEITARTEHLSTLLAEMEALGQPRSNYVLEHFVVGSHDRPGRQRQQVLVELRELMFGLAEVADQIRLAELDVTEMQEAASEASGVALARLEIKITGKLRQITQLRLQVAGRLRECDTLLALLERIPRVTAEEFEAEEAEYWQARLSRQYLLSQRDAGGNLAAVLEMLTEPGQPKPGLAGGFAGALGALGLSDEALRQLETQIE